jgi:hypothetical protein
MVYEFDVPSLGEVEIKVFYLPEQIYHYVLEKQGLKENYSPDLGGLSAILGWAAADIDLVTIDKNKNGQKTLVLWALGSNIELKDLHEQVVRALHLWLSFTGTGEPNEVQSLFERNSKSMFSSWLVENVDTTLNTSGSCVFPNNYRVFDILTLIGSKALEGELINKGTPWEGELVSEGPVRTLYPGKQLLRYKPSIIQNDKGNQKGLWTECIKVFSVSSPEKSRLRVGVKFSVRNYIEVHPARLSKEKSRKLDIFMPSDQHLSPGASRMRCISLDMKKTDYLIAINEIQKDFSNDRKVIDSITEFSGVKTEPEEIGMKPILNDGFMMLPRFGSGHGDKWAPAGTGTAHPDKENYLSVLDELFEQSGFTRITVDKKSNRLGSPKISRVESKENLLDSVLRTINSLGLDSLSILVFQSRKCTPELVNKAIADVLGATEVSGDRLVFKNGLILNVKFVPSGQLDQLVEDVDQEAIKKLDRRVRSKELNRQRGIKNCEAQAKIDNHISEYVVGIDGPWLALVEMNQVLKDKYENRDPYNLVYAGISRHGGLAQVTLYDSNSKDEIQENDKYVYEHCILDLIRSLGAPAIQNRNIRLSAWTVINTNTGYSYKPGKKMGVITPLYAQFDGDQILVSFLKSENEIVSLPYSKAIREISLGNFYDVRQLKFRAIQATKIEQFYADVVPNDGVETLTFVNATNIRSFVKGFTNGQGLEIDSLELGKVGDAAPVRVIGPSDKNTIVRIATEVEKMPSYWVENSKQGAPSGVYQEPGSERTFWITRGLPAPTQQGSKHTNKASRYEMSGDQFKNRYSPSLSEVFVQVLGEDNNDVENVVGLARSLMRSHITTDKDQTILPFPLHELDGMTNSAK